MGEEESGSPARPGPCRRGLAGEPELSAPWTEPWETVAPSQGERKATPARFCLFKSILKKTVTVTEVAPAVFRYAQDSLTAQDPGANKQLETIFEAAKKDLLTLMKLDVSRTGGPAGGRVPLERGRRELGGLQLAPPSG